MQKSPLSLAALVMAAALPLHAPTAQVPAKQRKMVRDVFGSGGSGRATRGPGWTHAQVKRMAKKRRNVLRNRRAHRGGR